MASSNEVVSGIYQAFAQGDVPSVLAALDPEIEWKEADGFPLAGTYRGHDSVVQNVFMALGRDWDGFAVKPDEVVGDGGTVVAYGTYSGTSRQTGKAMSARFAHVWTVSGGKAVKFEQIVDSVPVQAALG